MAQYPSDAITIHKKYLEYLKMKAQQVPAQPQAYSVAEIEMLDGHKIEFMVRASPSVISHLTKEMRDTGFLVLWNDVDTLCVQASQIRSFVMRQMTNQGETK